MPAPKVPAINTVLCAIDLSDITSQVLASAAEMAEMYDAKLLVVHVVEVWDTRYDFIVPDIIKKIEAEAKEKVRAELAHLGKTTEVPVYVTVVKGHASVKLVEIIRKEKPELVVVGSHGKRGIDQILLGSVAEKVVRIAPSSVLVVRKPKRDDITKIVCGVDFSDCSRAALERAIDIARREKINSIAALSIYEVPIGYVEAGISYERAFQATKTAHKNGMTEFLKKYADCGVKIESYVEEGPPSATMLKFAEKYGADLLVIGAHGRSRLKAMLFGGTSTKVVHRATLPVLAVKSSKQSESLRVALDKF
jgi:nucleotide-binding universal stress UspA family protein